MMDDFCAVILTHGRPDKVTTYKTLRKQGYTGQILIVVDDEDKTIEKYKQNFGKDVIVFSKKDVDDKFDVGDNFEGRRGVIYARNACFDIVKNNGFRYFIMLDDDYTTFDFRFDNEKYYNLKPIKNLDAVFSLVLDYFKNSTFGSIAFAQGGDFIGGQEGTYAKTIGTKRKLMNTFFLDVEKPIEFVGRINEDVNTYVYFQRMGIPFLTIFNISITQAQTQTNAGGMTELYLDEGTYVKSFYSVMYAPSCVFVKDMPGAKNNRIHHSVMWEHTAPCIIREEHKKYKGK